MGIAGFASDGIARMVIERKEIPPPPLGTGLERERNRRP
jgi:hypothetical protein